MGRESKSYVPPETYDKLTPESELMGAVLGADMARELDELVGGDALEVPPQKEKKEVGKQLTGLQIEEDNMDAFFADPNKTIEHDELLLWRVVPTAEQLRKLRGVKIKGDLRIGVEYDDMVKIIDNFPEGLDVEGHILIDDLDYPDPREFDNERIDATEDENERKKIEQEIDDEIEEELKHIKNIKEKVEELKDKGYDNVVLFSWDHAGRASLSEKLSIEYEK